MQRIKHSQRILMGIFLAATIFAPVAAWSTDLHGRIVVADRGSASITVINTRTDTAATIPMPAGPKLAEPMYVVYAPIRHRVFVGDRANNRVVVFDARNMIVEDEIPTGNGVFHMWASLLSRQLWVNNDIDKTATVIDTASLKVIATIPMPADLVALGGRPHDVILDPLSPFAYVTMIGFPGPSDYVVKFSTRNFRPVQQQQVGKDPHVSLNWRDSFLYVPCQNSGAVFVLDKRDLSVMPQIPVPGAHGAGMSTNSLRFYTTDFTSTGPKGLYVIDTLTRRVAGVADTPFSTPHNIALIPSGRKIYVTHSGANNHVSVYETSLLNPTPRLLKTITTGMNPFGLDFVP